MAPERPADKEDLYVKARAEIALIALMAGLLLPTFLTLWFAESSLGTRKVAIGVVAASFLLPALLLKGPLAARPALGIPFTGAMTAVAAAVTTESLGITVVCAAAGALAALAFYRIRSSTTYRPRLRGE